MSTTDRTARTGGNQIEVITNDDAGTVTFVADYPEDSILAPTEWITVDTETLVDVRDRQ